MSFLTSPPDQEQSNLLCQRNDDLQTAALEDLLRQRNDDLQTAVLEQHNLTEQNRLLATTASGKQLPGGAGDDTVCLSFLRTGKCRFGPRCFFQHTVPDKHDQLPAPPPNKVAAEIWSRIQRVSDGIEEQNRQHRQAVLELKAHITAQQEHHATVINGMAQRMDQASKAFAQELNRILQNLPATPDNQATALHEQQLSELRLRIRQEKLNFDRTIAQLEEERIDGIRKAESRFTSEITSLTSTVGSLKKQLKSQEAANEARFTEFLRTQL